MLLTTPTSLSFLQESSPRTNNSSPHIISLFHSHCSLSFSLYHPFPLPFSPLHHLHCHGSLCSSGPDFPPPPSPPPHSWLYWFLPDLCFHISISLNLCAYSISLTHTHTHTASISPSVSPSSCYRLFQTHALSFSSRDDYSSCFFSQCFFPIHLLSTVWGNIQYRNDRHRPARMEWSLSDGIVLTLKTTNEWLSMTYSWNSNRLERSHENSSLKLWNINGLGRRCNQRHPVFNWPFLWSLCLVDGS